MRNLGRRLNRLKAALAPDAKNTITMRVTCAATGEIISEHHLEFANHHVRRITRVARHEDCERARTYRGDRDESS